MGGSVEFDLDNAAYKLSEYLEHGDWNRDKVRDLVTSLNEAYFVWADSVDKAQIEVIE